MMKSGKIVAYLILLSITCYSCFRPEDFPDEPRIFFQDLDFSRGPNGFDTLILTFDFQDGDGDLGLDPTFDRPPVHDFDFIFDADTTPVTFRGEFEPPFFRLTPFEFQGQLDFLTGPFSDTDNRPTTFDCQQYVIDSIYIFGIPVPSFDFPISCPGTTSPDCVLRDTLRDSNGNIVRDANNNPRLTTRLDTFFIARNVNNRNIFIDFFRKTPGGEYEEVDFTAFASCGADFDGRFPVFLPDRVGDSVEGTIRYFMQSSGWDFFFRLDTFRIEARIQDLMFNRSNTIVTPDFTLQQLLNGG